jgi:hypothetical protein
VTLLPSEAEARQAVADAVDVYAAQAGQYAVFGPFKPSAGGQLSPDDAALAELTLIRSRGQITGW